MEPRTLLAFALIALWIGAMIVIAVVVIRRKRDEQRELHSERFGLETPPPPGPRREEAKSGN